MPNTGYWGEVTSTKDWCEDNYVWSHYVAEFFNCISSAAMVLVACFGLYMHSGRIEARFGLAFFCVMIVGFGSAAFHGTLLFHMQMLDEVPMLFAVFTLVYILLNNKTKRPYMGTWFPVCLFLYSLFCTMIITQSRGKISFYSFHVAFGSAEIFCLAHMIRQSFQ
eukprot:g9613.t1